MVIESVFEDLQLKKDLFNQMGEILKQRSVPADQMLLCSNTMNLSLADMTEDVCKEYRGCCIGMRFLHPVWFIDEVELADCDYTRRTTVNGAEKLLKQLFFQPFFYDNCYRRKLTLQEISTYQSRQMLRCPEPLKSLVPRRGFRRKNSLGAGSNSPGCCSPDQSSASSPVGSPSGPVGSAGEHVPVGSSSSSPHPESLLGEGGEEHEDKEEPCAVCLDEPRSALLVPCGHMAMCTECSMRVLRGPRPICVVCRQPIEKAPPLVKTWTPVHVHIACARALCLYMSCTRRGAHGVSPLGTAGLASGCSQGGWLCTYSARTLHALHVRPTGATRDAAALRAAVAGVGLLRSRGAALSSVLRTCHLARRARPCCDPRACSRRFTCGVTSVYCQWSAKECQRCSTYVGYTRGCPFRVSPARPPAEET